MKAFWISAAIAATIGAFAQAAVAADVGVAVTVGEPGFYGRIVLGNMPPPRVIYPAPVIIQRTPVELVRRPIYLRVPPGHEKKWGKHCARYNACGQPVYFVQDDWYEDVYAPRYFRGDQQGERGERYEKRQGKHKKDRNHERD